HSPAAPTTLPSFPTRRSSDLDQAARGYPRSADSCDRGMIEIGQHVLLGDAAGRHEPDVREGRCERTEQPKAAGRLGGKQLDDVEDRKSTRLNSSHQIISYAVF